MNPLVPPAISHLQNNPGASVFDAAIDHGVSYSTLRRAWSKVRPGTVKVGRPQLDRTKRALAFFLANPGMTQVSIAKQFKITPVTLSRALKRNG